MEFGRFNPTHYNNEFFGLPSKYNHLFNKNTTTTTTGVPTHTEETMRTEMPWTNERFNTFDRFNHWDRFNTLDNHYWNRFNTFDNFYPSMWNRFNNFDRFNHWDRFNTFDNFYPTMWNRFNTFDRFNHWDRFNTLDNHYWNRFNTFDNFYPTMWNRFNTWDLRHCPAFNPSLWSNRFNSFDNFYPSTFDRTWDRREFEHMPMTWDRFGREFERFPMTWDRFGREFERFPMTWDRFGREFERFPMTWDRFGREFERFPMTWDRTNNFGRNYFWNNTNEELCHSSFRPSSDAEFFTLNNPIRCYDRHTRGLWLCFDLRGYKPEEVRCTFDRTNRCITVEACHETKDTKEHQVTRKFCRKFVLPDYLKNVDLSKIELHSFFGFDGFFYVEGILPTNNFENWPAPTMYPFFGGLECGNWNTWTHGRHFNTFPRGHTDFCYRMVETKYL